jgi:hypothetical protein
MTRRIDSRRRKRAHVASGGNRSLMALVAVLATAAVVASPVLAARTVAVKPAKQRFSIETPLTSFQPPETDASKFSFTAAGSSPAQARLQTVERAFRFTPSGQTDNRKALSLGVNTRMVAATPDRSHAAAPADTLAALPTSYNVDLSVAWKGFALNTGFRRFEPGPTALLSTRREAVDIGVSYRGKNWKTSLQGIAEQGQVLVYAPIETRYSVELEGAYSLAPRLSVTGGVRYKLAPFSPSLLDIDRPDQSVYFGTNFAF